MERDSAIYKIRRRLQVMAHRVLPDAFLSKMYYRIVLKKKLNLKDPKTFNEKLQWLKLYYFPFDPKVVQGADKYAVREYIREKGYEDILVPFLGVWKNAKEIPWDTLPEQFVLKCNHGCAYNILCPDKKTFNTKAASKKLSRWLKEDFGEFNVEIHYSQIKERVIVCEEFLGECLTDYKFFCFGGEPYCMYVSTDLVHDRQAKIGFFDLNGNKMPLKREDYTDIEEIELPFFFEEMKRVAKDLAKDFPFVRVDFFVTENKYYFAELTFTPGGCMMSFDPDQYDLEWGDRLDLTEILKEK